MRTASFTNALIIAMVAVLLASCAGGHKGGFLPPRNGSAATRLATTQDAYATAILADHPTAYYRLDDVTVTVADSSGHGLNGTAGSSVVENAPGLLKSSTDTAMRFPALKSAAGIVTVPQTSALQPTSAITVETLLRLNTAPMVTTIAVAYGSNSNFAPYALYFTATDHLTAQFNLSSGVATVTTSGTFNVGSTYDVVATFDGSVARLYVNGAQRASVSKSGTLTGYTTGFGLGLGDDAALTGAPFSGTLDEVAIYAGSALSATQVQNHYTAVSTVATPTPTPTSTPTPASTPTPTGSPSGYTSTILGDSPTAYYRLDDTTATVADSSGHGLNGTAGSSVVKNAPGLLKSSTDTAMRFPGLKSASGIVTVPQTSALQPTSAISVETLLRLNTTPTATTIAVAYGSNANVAPYALYFTATNHLSAQFNLSSGVATVTTSGTFNVGSTYDVVATFDGSVARLYVNGAQRASVSKSGTLTGYTTGFGLGLGDDAALTGAPFNGTLDEVAIYAGSALSATQVQNHYTAASAVATPSPTPGPAYVDWNTFGFDLARTGNNPRETTLSASNASALHLSWGQALGGIIDAQPVVATGISINGTPTTVLYIGTENGVFYALNANTGAILWQKQLGIDQNTCDDLPNNTFGISGTATFDRATNRVYLADGQLKVHALDMSTGQEAAGWPVAIASTPSHDHVYGALTYNPATHLIYAGTGGYCDFTPYQGRVAAIDTTTHALVQTFFTSGSFSGAGVWGMGGVSIDTTTNNVYAATGNTITSPESSAFGDQLLLLSSSLSLIAANYPGLVGGDVDFGATPLQLHFSGCPAQVVAKNKSGVLVVWNTASIASGPVQKLQMAADVSSGSFIGVPAYLASSGLVYVGDPSGFGSFTNGLIALKSQNCTLFLAWQQTVGTPNASDANEAPTVANGVVYFGSGLGKQVVAFNALTGQRLWDSGTTISGPVFAAPTVDGRLFIGSWDGKLYAFGL